MGILVNIINSLLGYNDAKGVVNNPLQRSFDWERRYMSIPMKNGTSDLATIEPGGSLTIFDGTKTLPVAMASPTTELSIEKLDLSKSLYRLSITSGPGAFRTERVTSFNLNTQITTTVNNNSVMVLTLPNNTNGDFTNVAIGDNLRIKGVNTQDLSDTAFASVNSGYWVVIAKPAGNLSLTIRRPYNQSFQGVNETVTLGAVDTQNQIRIYSASGVQISDSFTINGTFSSASFNDYDVQQVGPNFIDFISGQSLPEETSLALSSVNDIIFYSNAKKLVYVECDQSIALRYNLDTSDNNLVKPMQVGNDLLNGFDKKLGFAWKCVVVNKSTINQVHI